jgi:hypothetical protein
MAVEFEILKLTNVSGNAASVYAVRMLNNNVTVFEKFILENKHEFKSEIKDIVNRLYVIGKRTGARGDYFKLNEGNPGDGVVALFAYYD